MMWLKKTNICCYLGWILVSRLSNISGSAYGLVFNMVYNESAKVDSKFSDVADIAPGKDNLHIKVRVIRMWKVLAFLNPSDYSSLEMVLVDEKFINHLFQIKMHAFKDKLTQKFSDLFPTNSPPTTSSSSSSSSQASSYPKEGKPLSSYLSYIIPSINFDGSNTSKHQHGHKATQSSSSGYNYEHFEYQDVPPDTYVDCDPTYNSMDLTKDETINEDQTSKRSSSSSEVFEEANEQQTPKISKKSPQLNLSDNSTFISPELYEFFESCLPNIVKGRQWVLLYSTLKHGISLRTLIRKSAELSGPALLIVGDMKGAVFGGLLECPLKPTAKRKYQGTNQTFVFTTVYGAPRLFRPTGANRYYYMCMNDLLGLGGGGNFALCLDGDLLSGTSGPCDTFGNLCLAHSPEFELKNIELWGFTHAMQC
ncbi:oxidation resistance protein [Trifolium repens]|nr:oxidation resistance protein [Trifolium repens]